MSIITNIDVYWAIAEEAHAAMHANIAESVSPKMGSEPGSVIRWDPDRRSFKYAMITIAFAGMYLDALLFIALLHRVGRADALKIDRSEHEERLKKLGITDVVLLDRVVAFREARKDLVHEKASEASDLVNQRMNPAQDIADNVMSLMHDVRRALNTS